MNYKKELPNSFTKNEYALLTKNLSKDKVLLEYGSGVSPLKLAE